MKTTSLLLVLWFAPILVAQAQRNAVSVELSMERNQFLPAEDMVVAVRISNSSGQTLKLGEGDWLTFYVEADDKFSVAKIGTPVVVGEFSLESSMTATKRVNFAPSFDLQKPGRYRVMAKVKVPQWNSEVSSAKKNFEIINGTKLQIVEFGVPGKADNQSPEVRKYILQQANYSKDMQLYLRLTDATETKTLRLLPLGRTLSFSRPEAQLDRFGNLHLLHLMAQRSLLYCVVNPDGQIITRETHDIMGDSRPKLRTTGEGRIVIVGGMRRYSDNDLPPSTESVSSTTTDLKPQGDAKEPKF